MVAASLAVLLFGGCASLDEGGSGAVRALTNPPNVTPYPFNTCAVAMSRPLDAEGKVIRRVYQGQEVLFCCVPCVRAFDINPEPFMPRILAAVESQRQGEVSPSQEFNSQ